MNKDGFISLHRKIEEWEWYDDANTFRLFIHCLLEANFKENKWRGVTINRGQFITSQPKLANSLKLSVQQIRTSLNKLKSTGEITVYTTADYSIITIKNYDTYQQNNSLDNSLSTGYQQSINRLSTTTNNDNNDNKENNDKYTVDLFINNYKTHFEQEYKRVFKNKPYLNKDDCYKIIELSKRYDCDTITQAIEKLKDLYFEDIDFKPSASWLLSKNNFEKLMNGEFDKEQDEEFDVYTYLTKLEKEKELQNGN